jgi:hypothetical protein
MPSAGFANSLPVDPILGTEYEIVQPVVEEKVPSLV